MAKADDPRVGSVQPVAGFPYKVKKDSTTSATVTYIGLAMPNTTTASAKWQIIRQTNATGDLDHADGDDQFDNIWDNRASLSYS